MSTHYDRLSAVVNRLSESPLIADQWSILTDNWLLTADLLSPILAKQSRTPLLPGARQMINLTLTRNGRFDVQSSGRSVAGHPLVSLIDAKDIAADYAKRVNAAVSPYIRIEGSSLWSTDFEALHAAAAIVLSMARNPCAGACFLFDLEQQVRQLYRDAERMQSHALDSNLETACDIKAMLWEIADIAERRNADPDSYLDAEAIMNPYRLQD